MIRSLFVRGTTIDAHTNKCFNRGVWTEAENDAAAMAHHRNEVREALREVIDGVPWAGETGRRINGKPMWRQLDLWDFEDYCYNIDQRRKQTAGDLEVVNRLIDRCLAKFGRTPTGHLRIVETDEPEV